MNTSPSFDPDEIDSAVTVRAFAAGQKMFGRYVLTKILGRGGMGVVWLAKDEELDQQVALKFLPEVVISDKSALDDLRREARRSRKLTHSNIVHIFDIVRDDRAAAISMEYIDGDTLANLRSERPSRVFEAAEIAGWVRQLCEALDYAHNRAQVVHRDLKPANLMVTRELELKVADFGIASSVADSVSRVSVQAGSSGTPVYMSPQQMMGEPAAVTDDIYSLGATLYELLTGKPPFYSGNILIQVRDRTPPAMAQRRAELGIEGQPIPAVWEQVVAACLAKEPAQRPKSVADVAAQLGVGGAFTPAHLAVAPAAPATASGPITAPPPLAAPSQPTVQPPPAAAPKPSWWSVPAYRWSAVGAGVVALVLALWAGDVVGRYKASGANSRGQAALLASDWAHALESFRTAVQLRSSDSDYRLAYDGAQRKWLQTIAQQIQNLSPEDAYLKLSGEPAKVSMFLVDPYAAEFKQTYDSVVERVRSDIRQGLAQAEENAKSRKFREAYAEIERVKPLASVYEPFQKTVDRVRIAEVHDGMDRAVAAYSRNNFSAAYAALESVKTNSALVPEYAEALQNARHAELRYDLGQTLKLADKGGFSNAFAALDQIAQRGLLPAEVEATRAKVRLAAELSSVDRLAKAIVASDVSGAKAIIDDYAKFTGYHFNVTAGTLVAERDFGAFVREMEDMRIRPTGDAPRRNRMDLVLAENLRTRFTDAAAVSKFVGQSYVEWAGELMARKMPGFALYALEQARREGFATDPQVEQAARQALAKEFSFTFLLPPTESDQRNVSAISSAARSTLKGLIGSATGSWARFGEGKSGKDPLRTIVVQTHLTGIDLNDDKGEVSKTVRYQSGWYNEDNPDYGEVASQLSSAESNYEQIKQMNDATQAQAQANASSGLLNAFGAVVNGLASGISQVEVETARQKVADLRSQLANTPRTVRKASYADEPYDEITHHLTYSVNLGLAIAFNGEDPAASNGWASNYTATTVEVVGNARRNVPVRKPEFPDKNQLSAWLASDLSARIENERGTLLDPLLVASFHALDQQLAARQAPPEQVVDRYWGLAQLWSAGNARPRDTSGLEKSVRETLGLPKR